MPFEFQRLDIPDLILVKPRVFRDERGFFLETYKQSDFTAHGIPASFVQDNHSRSTHGVLRGLHYQSPPQAQGKLVRVIQGQVFDVAVDLRRGSPTYRQWTSVTLSEETAEIFYIPPGFAHGFCVLSDAADFVYKVTAEYAPDLDAGIRWNDPEIGIDWPVAEPVVSPKDAGLPLLSEAEIAFEYEAL